MSNNCDLKLFNPNLREHSLVVGSLLNKAIKSFPEVDKVTESALYGEIIKRLSSEDTQSNFFFGNKNPGVYYNASIASLKRLYWPYWNLKWLNVFQI